MKKDSAILKIQKKKKSTLLRKTLKQKFKDREIKHELTEFGQKQKKKKKQK